MWYTHHLTESVKKALADSHTGLTLPLLSLKRHDCNGPAYDKVPASVCRAYEDRVSCASCHSDSPY